MNHDDHEDEEPFWARKLLDEMVNQMDSKLESKFNAMESRISVRIIKIESIFLELNNRYNGIRDDLTATRWFGSIEGQTQ